MEVGIKRLRLEGALTAKADLHRFCFKFATPCCGGDSLARHGWRRWALLFRRGAM